jgi:hypothetical protein
MNSERQKREEEIARLVRESGQRREPDAAFQEEIKKAASAMVQEEIRRIQKTERVERRKRSVRPMTMGLWLVVLGAAALTFSTPALGAALIICGMVAIVWDTVRAPTKKSLPRPSVRAVVEALRKGRRR